MTNTISVNERLKKQKAGDMYGNRNYRRWYFIEKSLRYIFENQGYTTILAGSRKEPIKNIDSSVDLLIVDIGLPDGDGINLYQELQKNGKMPARRRAW